MGLKRWQLEETHKRFGTVIAMGIREGEPYRFFIDKNKTISLIPLAVLLTEEQNNGTQ